MEIFYAPSFVRQLKKLEKNLQNAVIQRIEEFKNPKNHQSLQVHKLHGKYKNCYAFLVDYRHRIIFQYENKKEASLLAVGDHDVYH